MNRKVIFTCLTGGYDRLEQPVAVAPDWDYVCFMNGAQDSKSLIVAEGGYEKGDGDLERRK